MVLTVRKILAGLFLAVILRAQDPPKPAETPAVFSGTVVQTRPDAVTVSRKGLGTNATTKTFAIAGDTRIEGRIRLNVKVTVQFLLDEDGHPRAIHIIVR